MNIFEKKVKVWYDGSPIATDTSFIYDDGNIVFYIEGDDKKPKKVMMIPLNSLFNFIQIASAIYRIENGS